MKNAARCFYSQTYFATVMPKQKYTVRLCHKCRTELYYEVNVQIYLKGRLVLKG